MAANVIALCGHPNVGKSTIFNGLTGLRQHTGNWSGKTVDIACGRCEHRGVEYTVVDLPGCYSLDTCTAEEEVAGDFINSGEADVTVVICDATCLGRGLVLVMQTLEITRDVVVCVNLMDEADKRGMAVDLRALSDTLGVPVVGTSIQRKGSLVALMDAVASVKAEPREIVYSPRYPDYIEQAVSIIIQYIVKINGHAKNPRRLALMLLCRGLADVRVQDDIAAALASAAEEMCAATVVPGRAGDGCSTADNLLTGKWTAFPIMLLALAGIYWITIVGANYPSNAIGAFLFSLEDGLYTLLQSTGIHMRLCEMLVYGVFRVLAWVVSVMLPPMAIFFPLFTLLEDVGFLPRIAFNLDKCFKKCRACGKQALTMCMGLLILWLWVDL